jgi:hypothetical protein
MTQNELILMADASGISMFAMGLDRNEFLRRLEAFAKLVAAKEREACAKVCGKLADEALVCGDEDAVMSFEQAEDAIRARGQA